MKLLVIEGTDNSGKDLLISKFTNCSVKHFSKPQSKTNEECAIEQNNSFINFCKNLDSNSEDIVICNRAWYGEYVYGTLYRERSKEDVLDMIYKCEDILKEKNIDVTFVMLYANPEFLASNDDGKSLSNADIELISKECYLFDEVFRKSKVGKRIMIEVYRDGKFLDQWKIFDSVNDLLNN